VKTLRVNRDNWTGEIGTITYDPEKPLHFKVDNHPDTDFWLELTPWKGLGHLSDEDRDDILETLGRKYRVQSSEGYVVGVVTQDKKYTEGRAGCIQRDACDSTQIFTRAEKLLVTAARLIFNTV
jgi:hypothetical protein